VIVLVAQAGYVQTGVHFGKVYVTVGVFGQQGSLHGTVVTTLVTVHVGAMQRTPILLGQVAETVVKVEVQQECVTTVV
jgi:hypothetical protein